MKVLVDILVENYDRIVRQVGRDSRLYAILMNGVVVYDRKSASPRKVVEVLCDRSDAEMILDATKTLCPEATAEIAQYIEFSRKF